VSAARTSAALLLSIALALVAAAPAGAAWGTNNQHQLVPAYMYPDWWNTPNNWFRMCDAMNVSAGPSTAVMNPASGPGAAASPDYQRVIDYCHTRGQHVIGYVPTSYGARSAAAVTADIDAYYRMYPAIDGIFLDEMSNAPGTASYYRSLYARIKTKPGARDVVGNPGAPAATAWQLTTPVADAVVIFEGPPNAYQRWTPPGWAMGRVASQISNLVYAASQQSMSQVCALSKRRNAGYMYVTGDTLPNPWDTLPPSAYWSAEIAAC
jgi:spherulation-specific family 4 protein